jgi:hypothetical protein
MYKQKETMNEIQAKERCEEAVSLKGQIEKAYLTLAKIIKDIRDNVLYQPQYSKFPEFLQELDMTEGTASKMIKTYEQLVLEYAFNETEIEQIGWTKGYLVAKTAENKEEAVDLLEIAKIQTVKDLELTIKEQKTGINQMTCEHELQTLQICKKCGLKYYDK